MQSACRTSLVRTSWYIAAVTLAMALSSCDDSPTDHVGLDGGTGAKDAGREGRDAREAAVVDAPEGGGDVGAESDAAVDAITADSTLDAGPTLTAPSGLEALPNRGQLELRWLSAPGAVGYNLYFARQSGVTKDSFGLLDGGASRLNVSSPYLLPDLENNTTYYLVVTAIYAAGESAESNEISAMPQSIGAMGIAIEAGGGSALATTPTGLLVRVDLTTRMATDVFASELLSPQGIVIESPQSSVLVAESDMSRVVRINLQTGGRTMLADGLDYVQALAIEPSGDTVLATSNDRLMRIRLDDGSLQTVSIALVGAFGLAIESGGATALVSGGEHIYRVNLTTGTTNVVASMASAGFRFGGALAIEAGGQTVLAMNSGCLIRVSLDDGSGSPLGCWFGGDTALALESSGATAIVGESGRVVRTYLASSITPVAAGYGSTMDVQMEAGGTTALVVEFGGFAGPPHLMRVDLATGATQTVATPAFFAINGLSLSPDGSTAYTIGDWSHFLRIDTTNGSTNDLSALLSYGDSIEVEAGGSTALVSGDGLYRVDVASGAVTSLASLEEGGLAIEPGGDSILLGTLSGQTLYRYQLSTAQTTTIADELYPPTSSRGGCTRIAIEPGGTTVLIAQSGGSYSYMENAARILRVDTTTAAVTVVVPAGLSNPGNYSCGVGGLALEAGGATALVADQNNGLVRVELPAP